MTIDYFLSNIFGKSKKLKEKRKEEKTSPFSSPFAFYIFIEVWYIIPAIRKELAKHLTKKYELSYEKAGMALGVSKAAVSQYLSNKRANKIRLTPEIKRKIAKSAKIIADNPKIALLEMEKILKIMKDTKYSCEVCKKYNNDVLNYCGTDRVC